MAQTCFCLSVIFYTLKKYFPNMIYTLIIQAYPTYTVVVIIVHLFTPHNWKWDCTQHTGVSKAKFYPVLVIQLHNSKFTNETNRSRLLLKQQMLHMISKTLTEIWATSVVYCDTSTVQGQPLQRPNASQQTSRDPTRVRTDESLFEIQRTYSVLTHTTRNVISSLWKVSEEISHK